MFDSGSDKIVDVLEYCYNRAMPDVFISNPHKEHNKPGTPKDETDSLISGVDIPRGSYHRLSSFSFYPDHVDFETREKEEKVILLLRQHPIVNLKWIIVVAAMIFVPSLVKYFGIMDTLYTGIELVVTLAWYLVTMAVALENFLDWYFNVYIVTNLRIVDVDFYNLINKKVSDAYLTKIQDVSYTTFGVWRMLFNYGDVFVQTASEVPEFDFLAVPYPEKVVKILADLTPNVKSQP